MYVDNVEGEWGAFNEIMKRKDAAVQAQVGSLQMKIVAEDKVVEQKTTELLQEWEKGKPVQVRTWLCLNNFVLCNILHTCACTLIVPRDERLKASACRHVPLLG